MNQLELDVLNKGRSVICKLKVHNLICFYFFSLRYCPLIRTQTLERYCVIYYIFTQFLLKTDIRIAQK